MLRRALTRLVDLSCAQRSLLAAAMQTTTFADGEWIIKEGEDADSLYLITDGEVAPAVA